MKDLKSALNLLSGFLVSAWMIGCSQNPMASVPEGAEGTAQPPEEAPLLEESGSYAVLGGDIILDRANEDHDRLIEEFSNPGLGKSSGLSNAYIPKWPQGKVPYKFVGFTAAEQQILLSAMKAIEDSTGVDLVASNAASNSYVYVISKVTGQSYGGMSTLGYGVSSYCYINDYVHKGVAMHEFLHCLGICHEHQRPDRGANVSIILDNVYTKYRYAFTRMPRQILVGGSYQAYGQTHGAYDFASIMHYPAKAFSRNGKNTIVPKIGDKAALMAKMGQLTALSATDISTLRGIYGN